MNSRHSQVRRVACPRLRANGATGSVDNSTYCNLQNETSVQIAFIGRGSLFGRHRQGSRNEEQFNSQDRLR